MISLVVVRVAGWHVQSQLMMAEIIDLNLLTRSQCFKQESLYSVRVGFGIYSESHDGSGHDFLVIWSWQFSFS